MCPQIRQAPVLGESLRAVPSRVSLCCAYSVSYRPRGNRVECAWSFFPLLHTAFHIGCKQGPRSSCDIDSCHYRLFWICHSRLGGPVYAMKCTSPHRYLWNTVNYSQIMWSRSNRYSWSTRFFVWLRKIIRDHMLIQAIMTVPWRKSTMGQFHFKEYNGRKFFQAFLTDFPLLLRFWDLLTFTLSNYCSCFEISIRLHCKRRRLGCARLPVEILLK